MTGGPATGETPADRATGQHHDEASATETGVAVDAEDSVNARLRGLFASDRERFVAAVGTLALAAVTVRTGLRILANLPFDPVVASPTVRSLAAGAMPVAVAFALAALALTDGRPPVRVGLLFAAVFGSLGPFAPAATFPAVLAVAGGGALAFAGGLGIPTDGWDYLAVRRRVIAAAFVAGIAVSLAAATAILPGLRWLGGAFTLLALAAVGTRSEGNPLAAGAGVLAALALVYVGATSPYLVGTALLVAFAVTGVPNLLVALAVAGGVAAAVAGLRQREAALAAGAGLLLVAGVPATLPRAMAVLLGAALVVLDWGESATEVRA